MFQLTAADEVNDLHRVALGDDGRGVGRLLDDQPVVLHRHAPRVDLERLEKPADAYRFRHVVQLAVELNGHRGERTAARIASSRFVLMGRRISVAATLGSKPDQTR